MSIYILAGASLAFALAVTAAILFLLWKTRHAERTIQQLRAFAESLPEDERAIFWRLYRDRGFVEGQSLPEDVPKMEEATPQSRRSPH